MMANARCIKEQLPETEILCEECLAQMMDRPLGEIPHADDGKKAQHILQNICGNEPAEQYGENQAVIFNDRRREHAHDWPQHWHTENKRKALLQKTIENRNKKTHSHTLKSSGRKRKGHGDKNMNWTDMNPLKEVENLPDIGCML